MHRDTTAVSKIPESSEQTLPVFCNKEIHRTKMYYLFQQC